MLHGNHVENMCAGPSLFLFYQILLHAALYNIADSQKKRANKRRAHEKKGNAVKVPNNDKHGLLNIYNQPTGMI